MRLSGRIAKGERICDLFMVLAIAVAFGFESATLHAQSWQMPPDDQRCPSKWGTNDQRGSGNWMKPETVLRATKLIRTGEVFELGGLISSNPKESLADVYVVYPIHTNTPSHNSTRELMVAEMGNIGTEFDGLAHVRHGDSTYNCFKFGDIASPGGFKKLGVENVGMLMTRGVLIDVAGLKGVDMLPEAYVITPEDLQQALGREKLKLQPGDAVIIRTGWDKLMLDHERYGARHPGPGLGLAAGEWLARQDPMLIGLDACCVGATPQWHQPIHEMMIVQYGIHLIENMKLEALAAARAYEFAFIVQPLKLKGAHGSTIEPVAIR